MNYFRIMFQTWSLEEWVWLLLFVALSAIVPLGIWGLYILHRRKQVKDVSTDSHVTDAEFRRITKISKGLIFIDSDKAETDLTEKPSKVIFQFHDLTEEQFAPMVATGWNRSEVGGYVWKIFDKKWLVGAPRTRMALRILVESCLAIGKKVTVVEGG